MDILQKETAVNFLKGKEFKAILPDLKKVKFFSACSQSRFLHAVQCKSYPA